MGGREALLVRIATSNTDGSAMADTSVAALPPLSVRKQQLKRKARPDDDVGDEGERKQRHLHLADAARGARTASCTCQEEVPTRAEVGVDVAARVYGSSIPPYAVTDANLVSTSKMSAMIGCEADSTETSRIPAMEIRELAVGGSWSTYAALTKNGAARTMRRGGATR